MRRKHGGPRLHAAAPKDIFIVCLISGLRLLSSAVRLHIFIAVRAGSFGNFAAFCPKLFGSAQAALTGAENCGIIPQINLPPGSKRMHRAFAAHR